MIKELAYPFDASAIMSKKKKLKRILTEDTTGFLRKRIAILGGYSTSDIKKILELFLLDQGILPEFYESEYNKYYEDGMFENEELLSFAPDVIYVCICVHNINGMPYPNDDADTVNDRLEAEASRLRGLFDHLASEYHAPIICNNFEYPYVRPLGNREAYDRTGSVNFVNRLNLRLAEYASSNENFFICDVNYISAAFGLLKWSDPSYWYMYKYAVAPDAIPYLAFNVSNMIKSIFGMNKKALSLDLDNTLWGGVIAEDGVENIEIGQETATGEIYLGFQEYIKTLKDMGILLTVNSKNEDETAKSGLLRRESVLKPEDFVAFRANYEPKSTNLSDTAKELNIMPDSFVFVDDNPAERAIVEGSIPGVAVPDIGVPEEYMGILDRSGFFEQTIRSADDARRVQMYRENQMRDSLKATFSDYRDYLKSLRMTAEIKAFSSENFSRISQLTNKSNQFNLTTKRCTVGDIESFASDDRFITLSGALSDRFGDNGIVSLIVAESDGKGALDIRLWLMSCRVLKRDMEYAMMDALCTRAMNNKLNLIRGYYYPTKKNGMVKEFYGNMGFSLVSCDEEQNTVWEYEIPKDRTFSQDVIDVL